jgi:hypothetical protein
MTNIINPLREMFSCVYINSALSLIMTQCRVTEPYLRVLFVSVAVNQGWNQIPQGT